MTVPVLDLELLLETPSRENDGSRARALEQLAQACSESATFAVKNHGLPPAVSEALLSAAREFFALPMAEKLKVSRGNSAGERGFRRHEGLPNGLRHESFLWIDGLDRLHDDEVLNPYPDLWPEAPARFEAIVRDAGRALEHLSLRVYRAVALSAGLGEAALDFMNEFGSVQLHYYDAGAELPAHTDMAPLTIIFADEEGLEVELPGGRWAPVPSTGGLLACMLGDIARHLTNDRYQTAAHRVVRSPRPRHSVLWEPASHPRAMISPLPDFCSSTDPARYAPKSFVDIAREWIEAKQERAPQ